MIKNRMTWWPMSTAFFLLLSMIGWRETKQLKQNGGKFAIAAIICNCLGILSIFS